MLRNTKRTIVVVTTCTLAGMVSSGCSMSGRNLLTLKKKEPPAEVLAESGPTSSFPVPPSSQATPNAIASVAGGTAAPASNAPRPSSQPAQLAGLSASPGYSTSASPSPTAPNLAAAQANGIYGNTAAQSAGFQSPASPLAKPSGYTFGSKALTPKADATGTAFAMSDIAKPEPEVSATVSSGFTVPETSFAKPASSGYPTAPAIPQGGFTLPTSGTAAAAITPPKSDINGFETPAPAPGEILPPAATSPAFSTASTALETATPSAVLAPSSTGGTSGVGGYTPGSTGSATGYPSGTEAPATGGSIYR